MVYDKFLILLYFSNSISSYPIPTRINLKKDHELYLMQTFSSSTSQSCFPPFFGRVRILPKNLNYFINTEWVFMAICRISLYSYVVDVVAVVDAAAVTVAAAMINAAAATITAAMVTVATATVTAATAAATTTNTLFFMNRWWSNRTDTTKISIIRLVDLRTTRWHFRQRQCFSYILPFTILFDKCISTEFWNNFWKVSRINNFTT